MRWLALSVLIAGCGGKKDLSAGERDELEGCVKTMDAVVSADPGRQAMLYAEGCGEKLPGIVEFARSEASDRLRLLVEKSDLLCEKATGPVSGADASERWRLLIELCGAERYGLAPEQAALFSLPWFVVQRSAARAAGLRKRASGELADAFDAAAARVALPMPLPANAPRLYRLPLATHKDAAAPAAYVVVTADRFTAGAMPVARVSADGARIGASKGDPFPGKPIAAAELEAAMRDWLPDGGRMGKEDAEATAGRYQPGSRGTAQEKARHEGILGAPDPDRRGPHRLLILADAAGPAARALEAARHLAAHQPRFAVAGGFDPAAHTVALVPAPPPPPRGLGTGGYGRLGDGHGTGEGGGTGSGYGTRDGWGAPGFPRGDGIGGIRDPGVFEPFGPLQAHVRLGKAETWLEHNHGERILLAPDEPDFMRIEVRLRDWKLRYPDLQLLISADPEISVQQLVAVLDTAAKAGLQQVSPVEPGFSFLASSAPDLPPAERARLPQVKIGVPTVGPTDLLDTNIIRRYIRRHTSKISYCYEKELVARPGLEGTITVSFTISPQGAVSAARAEGGDPAVAACVSNVVSSIAFPKPKGAGSVHVRYPFTFHPTGD